MFIRDCEIQIGILKQRDTETLEVPEAKVTLFSIHHLKLRNHLLVKNQFEKNLVNLEIPL